MEGGSSQTTLTIATRRSASAVYQTTRPCRRDPNVAVRMFAVGWSLNGWPVLCGATSSAARTSRNAARASGGSASTAGTASTSTPTRYTRGLTRWPARRRTAAPTPTPRPLHAGFGQSRTRASLPRPAMRTSRSLARHSPAACHYDLRRRYPAARAIPRAPDPGRAALWHVNHGWQYGTTSRSPAVPKTGTGVEECPLALWSPSEVSTPSVRTVGGDSRGVCGRSGWLVVPIGRIGSAVVATSHGDIDGTITPAIHVLLVALAGSGYGPLWHVIPGLHISPGPGWAPPAKPDSRTAHSHSPTQRTPIAAKPLAIAPIITEALATPAHIIG